MPTRAARPCSVPRCAGLAWGRLSYCSAHHDEGERRRQDYERGRGTARQRGYTSAWERARLDYLAAHPWCVHCLEAGHQVAATDVDHIQPHKGDQLLFWDRSNWQGLCHPCHSRKTATHDGAFGRPIRPADDPPF